jgi:hypothetical protein
LVTGTQIKFRFGSCRILRGCAMAHGRRKVLVPLSQKPSR